MPDVPAIVPQPDPGWDCPMCGVTRTGEPCDDCGNCAGCCEVWSNVLAKRRDAEEERAEQPVPGDTTAEADLRALILQIAEPGLVPGGEENDDSCLTSIQVAAIIAAARDFAGVAVARERDAVLDRVRAFRDGHNPHLSHVCCVSDLLFALLGGDGDQP